ncbi:MAG TPA: glycosyltransferase family 4 protein, partial [Methylomirabilota bacterium]
MVPAVLVSEVFPPAVGGSGLLLEQVYGRLDGVPVTVLASGIRPALAQGPGRLPVTRVDMSAPDWGIVRPAALRRHVRVARAIRAAAPGDAVVHCARALPEGLSARLAGTRRRLPYVCWTHGEELGFASTSRELTRLMRYVYRHAAAVVANSRNTARLLENWGVTPERITVVYPGVDSSRFHPGVEASALRQSLARPGEVVFLSVGRLQRRKGHDLVLAALARLAGGDQPIRYVIAGDGPERERLEAQAASLGVSDRVCFQGAVDTRDLPAYYAASDVFVMPNRAEGVDFEGFGIVFLEAAASGRPAIGGRTGGVPEAIEENVTGLLVSGTDAGELADAMQRLARSPELRRQYGAAGRTRACEQFSWERSAA